MHHSQEPSNVRRSLSTPDQGGMAESQLPNYSYIAFAGTVDRTTFLCMLAILRERTPVVSTYDEQSNGGRLYFLTAYINEVRWLLKALCIEETETGGEVTDSMRETLDVNLAFVPKVTPSYDPPSSDIGGLGVRHFFQHVRPGLICSDNTAMPNSSGPG